jgi:hypothetical protein
MSMHPRLLLGAALAVLLWLAVVPNSDAVYRYRAGYGNAGAYGRYNSWNGGVYRGGAGGYNAYTGRAGATRSYYNPYTGRYGKASAVYNPYTGNYGARVTTGGW